jgi:hypothetical protein
MADIADIVRPPRRRPDTWNVAPVAPALKPPSRPVSLLDRLLHRRQPSTFHRCLAVHMHFAAPHKTLS